MSGLSSPRGSKTGVTAPSTEPVYTSLPGMYPRRAVGLNGEAVTLTPRSKLAGLFTYGAPAASWRSSNAAGGDGTVSAVDGALRITGGTVDGGITRFESRSHPRYEPDRQFGWGTATPGIIATTGKVRMGTFTTWEGFFLEVDTATGVVTGYTRRTTGIVAPSPEDHTSGLGSATITDTSLGALTLPDGADITKATLFDMWVQWRGVGNILALVNLQEALMTDRLGSSSDLWCGNPALPFAIEVERVNDTITTDWGCVDVSTLDGAAGIEPLHDSYSVLTGDVASMPQSERPLLVIQAAGFLAGMACTRDHVVTLINDVTCDAAATVRVYVNATVSNANVTWSIPDADRGIVLGVGSATATVTGGDLIFARAVATSVPIDIDEFQEPGAHINLRPIPGTATTGANRGDPAYGDTLVVTVEKTSGGTMTASCMAQIGSLF